MALKGDNALTREQRLFDVRQSGSQHIPPLKLHIEYHPTEEVRLKRSSQMLDFRQFRQLQALDVVLLGCARRRGEYSPRTITCSVIKPDQVQP